MPNKIADLGVCEATLLEQRVCALEECVGAMYRAASAECGDCAEHAERRGYDRAIAEMRKWLMGQEERDAGDRATDVGLCCGRLDAWRLALQQVDYMARGRGL